MSVVEARAFISRGKELFSGSDPAVPKFAASLVSILSTHLRLTFQKLLKFRFFSDSKSVNFCHSVLAWLPPHLFRTQTAQEVALEAASQRHHQEAPHGDSYMDGFGFGYTSQLPLNSMHAFVLSAVVCVAIGTFAINNLPPLAQKGKFLSLQDKPIIFAQISG